MQRKIKISDYNMLALIEPECCWGCIRTLAMGGGPELVLRRAEPDRWARHDDGGEPRGQTLGHLTSHQTHGRFRPSVHRV